MRNTRLALKIAERWLREGAETYEQYVKHHDTNMSKGEYERKYGPGGRGNAPKPAPQQQKPAPQKTRYEYKGKPEKPPTQATPDKNNDNKKRVEEQKASNKKFTNETSGDPAYQKKGKDVTKEDVDKFVAEFHAAFQETEDWHDNFLANGAKSFSGRLKDEKSLFDKMQGRFTERTLSSCGDVVGTRAICTSVAEQKKLIDFIYKNYEILEHDNSVDDAIRPDGYRAHHFTLKSKDGKLIELQVKTERQQAYSGYTHDTIYKGDDSIKKNPEVKKFTKALSDALYELDMGRPGSEIPAAPHVIAQEGLMPPYQEWKMDGIIPKNTQIRMDEPSNDTFKIRERNKK